MTTFTTTVAASTDDAQESSGTVVTDGVNLNANSTTQLSAMRFTGVTIPPGSTINNAHVTINITSTSYDDPDVTIRSSGEANPATFNTGASHLSSRSKTTASVSWAATTLGAGTENTPDLSTIVQETINLGSWASGNALAIYITGKSGSALRWNAYDNGSGIPSITIDYTAPTTGAAPRLARARLTTRVGGLLTA